MPADRFRGRSVHARVLPGGGGTFQEPRQDQGADVRRSRAMARAARAAGRHHDLVPPDPGRSGCVGAVGLFDAWVGAVSPDDYRHAILPHTSRIFAALGPSGVPRIHFGVGTGELLGLMGEAGADVVGVDWRIPLDEAVRRVEPGKALQGNLDPAILLAPWEVIEERAKDVVARGRTAEGHVFNLGHGVLPETDPAMLARLADLVHAESVRTPA